MKSDDQPFNPAERALYERITNWGRWAVGLALLFAVMVGIAFLPPFRPWAQYRAVGGVLFISGGVCGLASTATSAVALFRKRERSWLLYVTLVPGVLVLLVLLAELTEG